MIQVARNYPVELLAIRWIIGPEKSQRLPGRRRVIVPFARFRSALLSLDRKRKTWNNRSESVDKIVVLSYVYQYVLSSCKLSAEIVDTASRDIVFSNVDIEVQIPGTQRIVIHQTQTICYGLVMEHMIITTCLYSRVVELGVYLILVAFWSSWQPMQLFYFGSLHDPLAS
ncbi:hypothetical protein BJ878DRAFT_229666 [Calycina marina]|uniref:Uncharacterized protein n=1 Tax=Calycina marina TaxID=1763456 RepID=A0A9P7Z837_9HELO|nr:hypothetical protein BJ878DRAFT_229666 [Calycina marina]